VNVEEKVGIRAYIASIEGINGIFKEKPEDFYVEEIIDLDLQDEGVWTVVKVKKVNWDTMNFVRVLSNVLRISQKRIHFAGTKDKKAVTVQYLAIKNLKDKKTYIEMENEIREYNKFVNVLSRLAGILK